jgi:hypothetical protein
MGCAGKVNFDTAKTRFEKLLCVSEINYKFSMVNLNRQYLEGLNYLVIYKNIECSDFKYFY